MIKMQRFYVLSIVFMVILVPLRTTALLCYTCSYTLNESTGGNQTCVKDAKATRITDCDKKYCTIVRQEMASPPFRVVSFIRDCVDKPLFLNSVKSDETFKTYYRSCKNDLCNDSDGKHSATTYDPNFGAAPNQVIKGKRKQ